jgi:hypothetical protein
VHQLARMAAGAIGCRMNLPLTPDIRARREAGHVATLLHLGLPIDYVTIAGDEAKTFPLPDPLHTDWQTVLIDLAGSVAARRQPVWASEKDSQTAYEAAGHIARKRGMPTHVIRDEGLAETKKVIRAARSTVDAIAAALLEREMLSGDEVRESWRGRASKTRRGLGGC